MRDDCPHFRVGKRTLIGVAGVIWLFAGVNVAHLGIMAYEVLGAIHLSYLVLSCVVFLLFGVMFYKMSLKHKRRIIGSLKETRPIWHFFDLKSYLIMAIMMGGGIWLRSSGLAPDLFIAIFYTGLGCALAMAGCLFGIMFLNYSKV